MLCPEGNNTVMVSSVLGWEMSNKRKFPEPKRRESGRRLSGMKCDCGWKGSASWWPEILTLSPPVGELFWCSQNKSVSWSSERRVKCREGYGRTNKRFPTRKIEMVSSGILLSSRRHGSGKVTERKYFNEDVDKVQEELGVRDWVLSGKVLVDVMARDRIHPGKGMEMGWFSNHEQGFRFSE